MLLAPASLAGPPFQTDDPEPVELHHYEVYIASEYTHDRDGVSYTGPHVEVNYGVAPDTQLHVVAPYVWARPDRGQNERGYGDTELGVKYRFIHEGPKRPQVGVFPLVELPTGNKDKGLGNGRAQFYLPVWLQKSWGSWTTYGGTGYWVNPGDGNRDWWFTGWLVQRDLSPRLTLGGEVFHRTPDVVGGESGTGFNLGAMVNPDEGHHLLLSAGRDFHGPNRLTMYAGWQWTFGPREAKAGKKANEETG